MMMLSTHLSGKVEDYLGERKYAQLVEELEKPENISHIQNEGMDLITKLCENGLAFANDLDSIDSCSKCLHHVVHNYKPKESLICLLEQGEAFANSEKFNYLLPPLQYVMLSLPKKREKTFSWVLSILKSHVKYYRQFPEELKTNEEALLLEQDPRVKAILQTYQDYNDFYFPFVHELESMWMFNQPTDDERESVEKQKIYLRDYMVDLLGVPLIHFDLDWNNDEVEHNENDAQRIGPRVKTEARLIAEKLMSFLSIVDNSPLNYLQWIENRMANVNNPKIGEKKASKKIAALQAKFLENEEENEDEEEEIVVHMSSLVTYLYLIFDQHLPVKSLSHVYSPTYIFNMILYPVTTVLKNPNNIQGLKKAIKLGSIALGFCDVSPTRTGDFSYSHRLHHELLKREVHKIFIDRIAYLAVYCQNEEIRREAYILFKQYLTAFDPQGKYYFLQFILNTIPSDSLAGHMITELKQLIYIASDPRHPHFEKGMEEAFLGTSGKRLVASICKLKNGPTTDLSENSNQVISSLNLLRFLLLRDKDAKKIGILELFPQIEEAMLKPLRSGLDLSRAHFELKLKELNDPHLAKDREQQEKKMFENMKCDVKIGDQQVKAGDISTQDQKNALITSLNTFDHMSGLLAWVYEAHAISSKV